MAEPCAHVPLLVEEAVRRYFEKLATPAATETSRARSELARLNRQERTLSAAHDADRISEQLSAEDEARIRRERIAMTELVARRDVPHEALRETLGVALPLTDSIQAAYCVAERETALQALFERLEVDSEEISGHHLSEPYAHLPAHDLIRDTARAAAAPHEGRGRRRPIRSPGAVPGRRRAP